MGDTHVKRIADTDLDKAEDTHGNQRSHPGIGQLINDLIISVQQVHQAHCHSHNLTCGPPVSGCHYQSYSASDYCIVSSVAHFRDSKDLQKKNCRA